LTRSNSESRHKFVHLIGLVFLRQRADQRIQITVDDFGQAIQGQIDAVVGNAALREIIGADALAAIAGADLQAARFGLRGGLLGALLVEQARLEQRQRARAVLVLAAFVLAFHDYAGRQVRDADRRVGFVDVLAAGAGSAERVGLQVCRI